MGLYFGLMSLTLSLIDLTPFCCGIKKTNIILSCSIRQLNIVGCEYCQNKMKSKKKKRKDRTLRKNSQWRKSNQGVFSLLRETIIL
jgi:hypothetical protein